MMPEKKQGLTKQLLPAAAQAIGTAYGGPVGGAVGGVIGDKLAGGDKQVGAVETSAVQRRIDTFQGTPDPAQDLAAADQALAQLPEPVQQQYSPVIKRAMALEAQRGMA
jgi:hypothetical protein